MINLLIAFFAEETPKQMLLIYNLYSFRLLIQSYKSNKTYQSNKIINNNNNLYFY